ncbi:hypothetical protein [Segetibacter aerophilus]|uniref:Uncharacterized protein n=1 Tax=Segetibacter aerophilus TaxID=670293 RepID=A0A512BFF7_9BACT|nr:hypothetical protein [Segetibacter aerophilus]GEO10696.1 hypothetical protein SAE01_31920 [Segetibacter aerophilus]
MDTQPFFIEYLYQGDSEIAEVRPCCQENNVFYYDIYIRNEYQFTVTPSADEDKSLSWKISLKNADKNIEPGLIDTIGQQIEKHLL